MAHAGDVAAGWIRPEDGWRHLPGTAVPRPVSTHVRSTTATAERRGRPRCAGSRGVSCPQGAGVLAAGGMLRARGRGPSLCGMPGVRRLPKDSEVWGRRVPRGPGSPPTPAGVWGVQPGDGSSACLCSGRARFLPQTNENGDKKPGVTFRLVKVYSWIFWIYTFLKEDFGFPLRLWKGFWSNPQLSAIVGPCSSAEPELGTSRPHGAASERGFPLPQGPARGAGGFGPRGVGVRAPPNAPRRLVRASLEADAWIIPTALSVPCFLRNSGRRATRDEWSKWEAEIGVTGNLWEVEKREREAPKETVIP